MNDNYYITIELTFLKEFMLLRQVNQKSDVCHCWYFFHKVFKFQPDVCKECHDVLLMSLNLDGIAILNIYCADYHCTIRRISKSEAINLMQNIDLAGKAEHYKIWLFILTYKSR